MLFSRSFLPIFICQALGAFTDNFFKNAVAVLITFRLAETVHMHPASLISLGTAIFIAPFFLFSAIGGTLADAVAKHRLVRLFKIIEVGLCAIASASLVLQHVPLMFFSLFLLGTQAAFFGPVKYAILPELLPPQRLLKGNAWVEAGTFLSILAGTLSGGLLILQPHGEWVVSGVMMALALVGMVVAFTVPPCPAHHAVIRWNPWRTTAELMGYAWRDASLRTPILGISWFWAVGATYLTQTPVFIKEVMGGNEEVVTLFITAFSFGVAAGSLLSQQLVKRGIATTRSALLAMCGAGIFAWALSLNIVHGDGLIGAAEYLSSPTQLMVLAGFFIVAAASGVFVVPLYTQLQRAASEEHRARVIAANNILNAVYMTAAALAATLCFVAGGDVLLVLLIVAAINGLIIATLAR